MATFSQFKVVCSNVGSADSTFANRVGKCKGPITRVCCLHRVVDLNRKNLLVCCVCQEIFPGILDSLDSNDESGLVV